MSYCRFGADSDVYAYPTVGEGDNEGEVYICCGCSMLMREKKEPGSSVFNTRKELIDHLLEHMVSGDAVPRYAIERILDEMNENGELSRTMDERYPKVKFWQRPLFWGKPTAYSPVPDTEYIIIYKVDTKRRRLLVKKISTRKELGLE